MRYSDIKKTWDYFIVFRRALNPVFDILFSCWMWVIVCRLFEWQVPASGSVVIAGTIAAEIFWLSAEWRWSLNALRGDVFKRSSNGYYECRENNGELIKLGGVTGHDLDRFYYAAKKSELPSGLFGKWYGRSTVKRFERIVAWSIAISAIVGTLLWGYGELLYPHTYDELESCNAYVPISRLDACSSWEFGWLHRCEPADPTSAISSCQ